MPPQYQNDDDDEKKGLLPDDLVETQDRWNLQGKAPAARPGAPAAAAAKPAQRGVTQPTQIERMSRITGVYGQREHPEIDLASEGIDDIRSGEYQRGAHKLFGALGETLRPLAPLMGEARLPALVKGLGASIIGGQVGKHVLPAIGITPELGEDIGTYGAAFATLPRAIYKGTRGGTSYEPRTPYRPGRPELTAPGEPAPETLPRTQTGAPPAEPDLIPPSRYGGREELMRPNEPAPETLPRTQTGTPAPEPRLIPPSRYGGQEELMRPNEPAPETIPPSRYGGREELMGANEPAPQTLPRTRETAAPPPAAAPPIEAAAPTAGSLLDALARRKFGRPYDVLTSEEKAVVARDVGGRAPGAEERRVTRGQPPGVIERRAENMPLPTRSPEPTAPEIARPGQPNAEPAPSGTLPRTGPPAAPPPTTIGGQAIPRATLDEILRQATGQRRGQPSEEGKPPPMDPLKAEFPDPAIRKFARANGAELVRAAGDRPEVIQAVHDMPNVAVRQAAINNGIDVGTKHVGSKTALGPEQVTRQDLIDQMIRQGVKPEDIPAMGKPQTRLGKLGELLKGESGTLDIGKLFGLPHVPDDLARHLEPDEIEFLKGRNILQKNLVKAYGNLGPTLREAVNVARAGHGLGGWWQRFMDTFEALGAPIEAQQMKQLGPAHAEALKALHGAVSGNKAVEQANVIAWGVYRDWLQAGRPTDLTSINRIVRANRGISGRGGLDTQKVFKLVNSPQFQKGVPFTGEAFLRSPVEGVSPGAKKIPSMVATTAEKGNLKRIVFDTHMKDLYGINNLSDAQYLAASIHVRQTGEALGYAGGEAQEQMWGTVLGLKQLLGKGLSPRQAAQAYGKDVLAQVGKDYAQVIQDSMGDKEVQEIMRDLKKYGFDPGGPVASERLRQIVTEGAKRMSERARPISRGLLEKTARRIASSRAGP